MICQYEVLFSWKFTYLGDKMGISNQKLIKYNSYKNKSYSTDLEIDSMKRIS